MGIKDKMWGGRFKKEMHPLTQEFTRSIHFDYKLAEYDCLGSLVHINILKRAHLLNNDEYKKLKKGLSEILESVKDGSFRIERSFEDIHTYIQYLLEKKAGKVAFKLHTARSRNDQIVFDVKCYCLVRLKQIMKLIRDVIKRGFSYLISANKNLKLPGYTHLQHAMPISLTTYLGAYRAMLERDYRRLKNIYNSLDLNLGAGALAGTFIPPDRYAGVIKIGDIKKNIEVVSNPVDMVSDRDFIIEILSSLAMIGMHLSRLAEDFILWSTREFDFIEVDESFCTGSSLMPQKKNPDILELIRGTAGRLYGNLLDLFVIMKGLPLAYNRDMQLDKEPLFDSFELVEKELNVLMRFLPTLKFKKENIKRQLEDEGLYATYLVDYLVQKGVAFKDAHRIIGRLIRHKLDTGKDIRDMDDMELREFHSALNKETINRIISR